MLVAPANLSTALLIGATSLLLMFIGRVSTKHIGLTIGVAAIPVVFLIIIAMAYYNKEEGKSEDLPAIFESGRVPTWIKRVQNFVYDSKQTDKEENYQVNQAKIAIAKGGIIGLGPGNSEQRNFFAASLFRFYLRNYYRRIWHVGRRLHHIYLPGISFQEYKDF